MDILEQLKKEQAERAGLPRDEPMASDTPRKLQRALERLYAGLERLAEGLRELAPNVRVAYDFDGVGKLTDLRQEGYAVQSLDAALPRFAFCFSCVGEKPLSRIVDSVGQKDVIREYLESHDVQVRVDDLSTWRYVITLVPKVPVRLVFEPSPDLESIRVTARNLDGLGSRLYSLHPDVVRNELMSEIGKLVLRRENGFAQLAGNVVAGDIRERLQARVRARQQSRAQEAGEPDQDKGRGGLKGLLPGRDASASAPAPRRAPSIAPNLSAEQDSEPGIIEWDAASVEQATPSRPARAPEPAAPPRVSVAPASVPRAAQSLAARLGPSAPGTETPPYAWLITSDVNAVDTAASVGRRGPRGADRALTTSRILKEGEQFRLLTREGDVRFRGAIAGKYQGVEPLVDFGIDRDCYLIQYLRDGKWVRVRPTD